MCQIHNRFVASGKATEIAFRNASSLSVKIPFDLYQSNFWDSAQHSGTTGYHPFEMNIKQALNDFLKYSLERNAPKGT